MAHAVRKSGRAMMKTSRCCRGCSVTSVASIFLCCYKLLGEHVSAFNVNMGSPTTPGRVRGLCPSLNRGLAVDRINGISPPSRVRDRVTVVMSTERRSSWSWSQATATAIATMQIVATGAP
ncbi:unnamed protein product, partial [Ectocarpus sp. 12 AP-2014]